METRSGDITLTAGDGEAVTGTVRKESRSGPDALDAVSVTTATSEGVFLVRAEWSDRTENVSVDFDLEVPPALPVERAQTVNGDLAVEDVDGHGTYRTENGSVDVENADGYVTVASRNGDVTARDVGGLDGARTTNGEVAVDVPAVRRDVTCATTNGDVRLTPL
ncbi:MAG: hypothetical protein ABEJ40_05270 [Haloarculaceae archaeon]